MKYLFFDIECANCWENKGKICSFGYVIVDENFNLLEKKDIIINPRAKFDYRGLKIAGIDLPYTEEQYKLAPSFSGYYEEIKALITNKDYIICGHSTSSDAKYLLDECDRYKKLPFDYIYIDTIKLLKLIYDRNKDLSLGVLYEEFYPNHDILALHKSDDDAFMTMKIAQHISLDKNITLNQVISQNTLAKGEVFKGRIVDKDATIFNYSNSNKIRNSNSKIFDQLKKEQIVDKNGKFYPKKYCIEHSYENNNFAQMLLIVSRLNKLGARYVSNEAYADIYVEKERKEENELYLGKNVEVMLLNDFIKQIGLSKQDLVTKNIDCDELIGNFPSNAKWYNEYKQTHLVLQKIDNFIDNDTFECSVDFPVIQYVCQAKSPEQTAKIYRFYDPVLNGFFARHPYRVNRASNSYLPPSIYEKAIKKSQFKLYPNIKRSFKDKQIEIDVKTTYNYIVSYKFLGKFEQNKINFTIYEEIIADKSFEKCIKISKEAINIDLKGALMQYYYSDLLAIALRAMSKFSFGYKDNSLVIKPVEGIKIEENDRLHLPKKYYEEYIKSDKTMQGNTIISQGSMFIPTILELENNLFDEKIILPVVIERRRN